MGSRKIDLTQAVNSATHILGNRQRNGQICWGVARLCDYNGDGEITVKDVLAMQKYVAKVA